MYEWITPYVQSLIDMNTSNQRWMNHLMHILYEWITLYVQSLIDMNELLYTYNPLLIWIHLIKDEWIIWCIYYMNESLYITLYVQSLIDMNTSNQRWMNHLIHILYEWIAPYIQSLIDMNTSNQRWMNHLMQIACNNIWMNHDDSFIHIFHLIHILYEWITTSIWYIYSLRGYHHGDSFICIIWMWWFIHILCILCIWDEIYM